jgi:hypothetical protein
MMGRHAVVRDNSGVTMGVLLLLLLVGTAAAVVVLLVAVVVSIMAVGRSEDAVLDVDKHPFAVL